MELRGYCWQVTKRAYLCHHCWMYLYNQLPVIDGCHPHRVLALQNDWIFSFLEWWEKLTERTRNRCLHPRRSESCFHFRCSWWSRSVCYCVLLWRQYCSKATEPMLTHCSQYCVAWYVLLDRLCCRVETHCSHCCCCCHCLYSYCYCYYY